eukprot:1623384-Rhodomonas_salina.1
MAAQSQRLCYPGTSSFDCGVHVPREVPRQSVLPRKSTTTSRNRLFSHFCLFLLKKAKSTQGTRVAEQSHTLTVSVHTIRMQMYLGAKLVQLYPISGGEDV